MTAFSTTQKEIFNQFRCKSERRKKIADEVAGRQAVIQRLADELIKEQGEIAKLLTEDAKLQGDVTNLLDQLDENGAVKPVLLDFSDGKTIHWGVNRSVTLTKKPYDIIKTLYLTAKRRMPITSLEARVWGKQTPPSPNTAKVTVCELNKALRAANCPYKVIRTQCKAKTVSVKNPVTQNVQEVAILPKIEVYKLVRKKI